MQKVLFVFGILGIILISFLSGCIETKETKNLNISINISTEKSRYTANELIKIYVDVNSNSDLKNVTLNVYGITSRQGDNLVNVVNIINLTKGTNRFNFSYNAPYCTHGCGARYYPGTYFLFASVSYIDKENNITILEKANTTVELY